MTQSVDKVNTLFLFIIILKIAKKEGFIAPEQVHIDSTNTKANTNKKNKK